jgi:hypothetical protein
MAAEMSPKSRICPRCGAQIHYKVGLSGRLYCLTYCDNCTTRRDKVGGSRLISQIPVVCVRAENGHDWGQFTPTEFMASLREGILPLGSIWKQHGVKYVVCGKGREWLEAAKHDFTGPDGWPWEFSPEWLKEI